MYTFTKICKRDAPLITTAIFKRADKTLFCALLHRLTLYIYYNTFDGVIFLCMLLLLFLLMVG